MRKLALVFTAFGFIAFAGVAHADDQKTENTQKSDTSTTLTGKRKVTHSKKMVAPDGTTTETKSETTMPKNEDKRMDDRAERRDSDTMPARHEDNNGQDQVQEKTEHHTTLTGKKQLKTTKKLDRADGTSTETTTTRTEGDKK
jgi:hypothetical protein